MTHHTPAPEYDDQRKIWGAQKLTWILEHRDLRKALECLEKDLDTERDHLLVEDANFIKVTRKNDKIPHKLLTDRVAPLEIPIQLSTLRASITTEQLDAKARVPCCLCGKVFLLQKMQGHVGEHFLCAVRKINENLAAKVGQDPCGFCGIDGCITQLIPYL
jgi:hypothetical protein